MGTSPGIAAGNRLRAKFVQFFNGIDGHIAGTGNSRRTALDTLAPGPEHVFSKVDAAVACGFLAGERPAPLEPLAGRTPSKLEVSRLYWPNIYPYLTRSHADIPGGHVAGSSDIAGKVQS